MIRALVLRELLFWAKPARLTGGILLPAAFAALLASLSGPAGEPAAAAILALAAASGAVDSVEEDRGNDFCAMFLRSCRRSLPNLVKVAAAQGAPFLYSAWILLGSRNLVAAPGLGGPLGCAALAASLSHLRLPSRAPVFALILIALWSALTRGPDFGLPSLLATPIMVADGSGPFRPAWPVLNVLLLAAVSARGGARRSASRREREADS